MGEISDAALWFAGLAGHRQEAIMRENAGYGRTVREEVRKVDVRCDDFSLRLEALESHVASEAEMLQMGKVRPGYPISDTGCTFRGRKLVLESLDGEPVPDAILCEFQEMFSGYISRHNAIFGI